MSINYAAKYSNIVDERFKSQSVTDIIGNTNYDWVGTKTVNVYSVPTATMNDYTRTGANRYGTPSELEPTAQELTLSKDRAFTFTIDRGNYEDTQMVAAAAQALQRQIDEVIVPELDKYRLEKLAAGAGLTATPAAVTKSNAYSSFLDGTSALLDKKVPLTSMVAYISNDFYKFIRQDESFVKTGDLSQDMLIKGQVGMIDGVPLVYATADVMPADTAFIITAKEAIAEPVKLSEYKTHDNPPGINGWLVEGRIYYDAFVLNNKKNGIYVHSTKTTTGKG